MGGVGAGEGIGCGVHGFLALVCGFRLRVGVDEREGRGLNTGCKGRGARNEAREGGSPSGVKNYGTTCVGRGDALASHVSSLGGNRSLVYFPDPPACPACSQQRFEVVSRLRRTVSHSRYCKAARAHRVIIVNAYCRCPPH